MDDLTQLQVHIADHVATLTMNAPPVNALTRTLNDELTLALDRISELDAVRAVVLTAAGKVFCAGADLKGRAEVIKGPGDLPAHSRRTRECFHAIRECAKPVVVAINGAALGSGVAMVASSDILVASETASLGLHPVIRKILQETDLEALATRRADAEKAAEAARDALRNYVGQLG